MNLKHSSDAIDLDNSLNQKLAIQYLLDKVRDNEKLLVAVAKENRTMSGELSELYTQNDALAAENISLKDTVSLLEQNQRKFALVNDLEGLKTLVVGNEQICSSMTEDICSLQVSIDGMKEATIGKFGKLSNDFYEEIDDLKEMLDDLKTSSKLEKDELCSAVVDDFADLEAMMKSLDNKFRSVSSSSISSDHFADNRIQTIEESLKEVQQKACRNLNLVEGLAKEHMAYTTELKQLEKDITVTNQYNRRQNLVIDGIPENVHQNELEEICIDLIQKLGFQDVGHYEVEGCHRLRKRKGDVTPPTIIRFINRKIPEYCKKNRWRLRNLNYNNWNLSFRDDLNDANDAILKECEKLVNSGKLHKVYTYNGFVRVVKKNGDHAVRLSHIKDVYS